MNSPKAHADGDGQAWKRKPFLFARCDPKMSIMRGEEECSDRVSPNILR